MLFGTSGIRGIYGTEVTPGLAMGIANAFGGKGETVAVASDLRETSELLKQAVVSGILAGGANAVDLGEVPTPTLALYTQRKECRGVMITASHNPPEYNGLKLYRNGREISKGEEEKVERNYGKGMTLCNWDEAGRCSVYENAVRDHIEMIKRNVDVAKIRNAELRAVVDTNGVGTKITPLLLRELGCEAIEINKVGKGFARNSEPNDANLAELKTAVKMHGAQIGIGHDGDADRAIFVDEKGGLLGLDVQLAVAIEHELAKCRTQSTKPETRNRKPAVVSTVEASFLVRETVEKNGGKSIVVGVGSTNVSESMEKNPDAVFGGEPAGEYIYKNGVNTPDGILATAKFLEIIAEKGKLSELGKKYRTYPILREQFKCMDREKAMERIRKGLRLGGKLNEIDGLRFDFGDGFVLVRASGTEPAIRLTAEFRSEERLKKMAEKAKTAIMEAAEPNH